MHPNPPTHVVIDMDKSEAQAFYNRITATAYLDKRATDGSYAIVDLNNGRVRFFNVQTLRTVEELGTDPFA